MRIGEVKKTQIRYKIQKQLDGGTEKRVDDGTSMSSPGRGSQANGNTNEYLGLHMSSMRHQRMGWCIVQEGRKETAPIPLLVGMINSHDTPFETMVAASSNTCILYSHPNTLVRSRALASLDSQYGVVTAVKLDVYVDRGWGNPFSL